RVARPRAGTRLTQRQPVGLPPGPPAPAAPCARAPADPRRPPAVDLAAMGTGEDPALDRCRPLRACTDLRPAAVDPASLVCPGPAADRAGEVRHKRLRHDRMGSAAGDKRKRTRLNY